jgi:protein SCO1/2
MACGALTRSQLDSLAVEPAPDARLPLNSTFIDERGSATTLKQALGAHAAVLVFADYTCRTLCGPILSFAAGALEKSGLTPGADYRLIVIGLDPRDGLESAQAMKQSRLGENAPLAAATTMLSGGEASVRAVTAAAGYHYVYDPEHDQFAHPAVAYVVTADGRIARMLSGLGLDAADMRLALIDAGRGHVGSFIDRIHLLCYGFDPAQGIYTASITAWLELGGLLTVVLVAAGVAFLTVHGRRGKCT